MQALKERGKEGERNAILASPQGNSTDNTRTLISPTSPLHHHLPIFFISFPPTSTSPSEHLPRFIANRRMDGVDPTTICGDSRGDAGGGGGPGDDWQRSVKM